MDIPTLNRCPGYNLYIGGFIALRRPKALQNCHITHIVSVMDWKFEEDNALTRGFQHLHIPVDDVEDENLLRYFPQAVDFIHKGLKHWQPDKPINNVTDLSSGSEDVHQGSGVLIHCAMGKSRSATVLLAYLLWLSRQSRSTSPTDNDNDGVALPPEPLSVIDALTLLRRGRPIAEPNEGFMDQLYLYVDMGCPTTSTELESHKLYRRFMNKRNVAESLATNQAPDVVDILFEDEDDDAATDEPPSSRMAKLTTTDADNSAPKDFAEVVPGVSAPTGAPLDAGSANTPKSTTQVRCRRCRTILASTPHIVDHKPSRSDPASQPCAHIFLHPLSWMRETLAEGQLDGRLSCPTKTCGANVGKFAWQGLRCSCGGWVTPGFGVGRARVDEVEVNASGPGRTDGQQRGVGTGRVGGAGIRLPPGMRRDGNL
ncbi:uncharacterized protein HMPREF1541_04526 [Cyphellophora europaea CBS 101466]|uniref:protein-tyrosine-phosphatase n=1 Tax=Cyphellophora europaea (strain CBS 101466) TaxID=1220924 RepID=W2RVA9_CYPE1|nr:uncharacterized protein HMPREF1541_04526 [Cyphellophora europaea CBS 101466]ETN40250.1 hypothetical protein HMPREF1541_04526 [Cyphellophora europaea CBS 101466]